MFWHFVLFSVVTFSQTFFWLLLMFQSVKRLKGSCWHHMRNLSRTFPVAENRSNRPLTHFTTVATSCAFRHNCLGNVFFWEPSFQLAARQRGVNQLTATNVGVFSRHHLAGVEVPERDNGTFVLSQRRRFHFVPDHFHGDTLYSCRVSADAAEGHLTAEFIRGQVSWEQQEC